jgi:DNA helicase-2/ATP-dependent DNA helicase PcrA
MSYKQTCLLNSDIWSNKFKVSNNKHVDKFLNKRLRRLINVKKWSYGTNTNKFLNKLTDHDFCEYQYQLLKKYFNQSEKYLKLDCDRLVITFECTPTDIDKLLGLNDFKDKGINKFSNNTLRSTLFCKAVPVGNINYGTKGKTRPYYNHAFNLRINNKKQKSLKLYVADGANETTDSKHRQSYKKKKKLALVETPLSIRLDFIPQKFSDFEISLLFNHLKSKLSASRYSNFINTAKVTRVDVAFNMPGVLSSFVWCMHDKEYIKHDSSIPHADRDMTETVYLGHRSKSSHFIIYDKLLKEFKTDVADLVAKESISKRFDESSVVTRIEHRYYPNRSYNSKHESKRNKRRIAVLKLKDLSSARIALHDLKIITPRILPYLNKQLIKEVIRKREYFHIKSRVAEIRMQVKASSGKSLIRYFQLEKEHVERKKVVLLKHYQSLIAEPLKTPTLDLEDYISAIRHLPKEKFDLHLTDYTGNIKRASTSQVKAAKAKEPYVMVIAGAGSGKTKTIVDRVKYLISRKQVDPRKIRVLAYTNDASKELEHRINKKPKAINIGDRYAYHNVGVSTFSSWCKEVLDKYCGNKYRSYNLFKPRDAMPKLYEIAKGLGFESYEQQKKAIDIIETSINRCCSLSKAKEYLYASENIDIAKVRKVRKRYQQYKEQKSLYDFTDFIKLSHEELKLDESRAESISKSFKYLIIDEMQDSNKLQWNLLSLLTEHHTSLFCVGDPAQSIYGFRGSSYRQIERFKQMSDDAEVYPLTGNFRTTESILKLTNFVRKEIGYEALDCCTTSGNLPQLVEPSSLEEMLVWLRRDLLNRRAKSPKESIQILLRTNPAVNKTLLVIENNEDLSLDIKIGRIKIRTMHSSKGTESDVCYVIDPRLSGYWLEKKADVMRLLYVALTRAKKQLVICKSMNGRNDYLDSPNDIYLLDLITKQDDLYQFVDN